MIHPDSLLFEVNVGNGQSAELRDTQACIKQDEDPVVIFAVTLVLLDELQESSLLSSGDGISGDTVIDHNRCQLKLEGILVDQIILQRHFKGRPYNTPDGKEPAAPLQSQLVYAVVPSN
jgi:hypothetical protein